MVVIVEGILVVLSAAVVIVDVEVKELIVVVEVSEIVDIRSSFPPQ